MWSSGRMKMKRYLYCIYCKVKTRIQGERCHTLRSRCVCVWNIYGGYPNSTMLLKTCLPCLKLENTFAREHGLSFSFFLLFFFFSLFFHSGHLSTYCFLYLGHLPIFSNTFLLHIHMPLSAIEKL
jgi:hypothetical protein